MDLGAQIDVLKAEREVLSYADENAKKAAKRIQKLTTANHKLDQELTELKSTHERLQHAAAGLKRGMAAAEQARAAAEAEAEQARAAAEEAAEQARAAAEAAAEQARVEAEKAVMAAEQAKKRFVISESKLKDQKGKNDVLNAKLVEASTERDWERERAETLSSDLAKLKAELEGMAGAKDAVEYWKGEAEKFKSSVEDARLQLDTMTHSLEELQEKVVTERCTADMQLNGLRQEAWQQRKTLVHAALSSMEHLRHHLISTLTGMRVPIDDETALPFVKMTGSPHREGSPSKKPSDNSMTTSTLPWPSSGILRRSTTAPIVARALDYGSPPPAFRSPPGTALGARTGAENLVLRLQTPTLSSRRNARGCVRLLEGLQHSSPQLESLPQAWQIEGGKVIYTTMYTSSVPAAPGIGPAYQPPVRPGSSFSLLTAVGQGNDPPPPVLPRSASTPNHDVNQRLTTTPSSQNVHVEH